jgi:type I restriction enzyme, S subunit
MNTVGWFDSLPAKWRSRRLKYAAKLGNARTDGRPDGARYLGLENVESWTGRLIESEVTNDKPEDAVGADSVVNCFARGDVLFGKLRPYLAKAHLAEAPGVCTTELLVTKPASDMDGRFLLYSMLNEGFISLVDSSTFGSKMPRADWDFVGNVRVPVPSLPEQRAIADFLDRETARLDALVAAKQRWLELVAEKRRALITRAVTRGLIPAAPLRDSGLSWLGQVPAHWQTERLKFHLHGIEQGWSPQCENNPADDNEWGVLKAGCVNAWAFDPTENKRLPDGLEPATEYEIKAGDMLMSRANTTELLGSTALVREVRPRLLLCDKLYRLNVKETRLDKEFLFMFLRSPVGHFEFERDATGASNSMQNIGQDSVCNLWLPVPPLDEQRAIVAYISAETAKLDALRAATERTIGLLKERRAALIAAAVTGKLAIN